MVDDSLGWEETPEQIEQVWARRAAELARVPPREQQGARANLLIFRLGQDLFAFEARYAHDIRPAGRITRVPRVPAWVTGITSQRGRILSVLDLALFLDLPRQAPPAEPVLVVVCTPGMELVLLVDQVLEVQDLALDLLQEPAAASPGLPPAHVRGVAVYSQPGGKEELLTVLDLASLLAAERVVIDQQPG